MNIELLLKELIENKVKLSVKEDKLLCQLPEKGIDDALFSKLQQHKEEVKQFIQNTKKNKLIKSPILKQDKNALDKPLSFAQQRLWVLDQIEGSTHYNISNALLLKGNLNKAIFQKAFDTILERHEVLRTVYDLDKNGNAIQIVQPFVPIQIGNEDLRSFNKEEQDTIINKIQTEESKKVFNLKSDIMLRVKLLQIKEDEFIAVVNMHHIATDGWSIGILINEFNTLYTAYSQGKSNPLTELEIQYSDYAHWQQEILKDEKLEELKSYWLNQLSDLPPVHNLPLDYARPKVQTFEGNTIYSQIDSTTLNSLKKICDKEGATLFTGLHTIFGILLARYSNETDIIMGTPIANREQSEVKNLIGFFVNMLVLRSNLSQNESFVTLINRNKEMMYDAFSHQQMPFDMLVSELQPKRNPNYSSLFQIMFVLQNNERAEPKLPELSLKQIEQSKPFAMYDLSFTVNEDENGLSLSWEYNKDIFKRESIERMSNHFERLFKSLIEFPNANVGKANIISNQERNELIIGLNQTDVKYETDKTVLDLFEEQVKSTPDYTAVKFEEKEYSYHQLNQLANQLANYLKENYGITANDLVGIQLDRSEKMPLSIISILKAGGAYVPIGIDYPEDRVSYIIEDAKIKVMINERELEKFFSVKDDYSTENLSFKPVPSDLAYCIYTSGSTGVPKGVLNQHAGLFNRLVWMKDDLNVKEKEVFLQKTPYTFDVSVWEFLLPVSIGSTLIIAKPDGHKDPEYLKEIIEKEQVSIIHFVPSMLSVFLQFATYKEVSALKHIICSGEELLPKIVSQSKTQFPQTRIHNYYGPTEAAIDVTAIDVTDLEISNTVTIGKPVANTRIYIVDSELNLQPAGIAGELLISGIQVAKGYLNLPDLTKERFINDPFISGERVYRTGDIASWNEDGTIKYLGRKDNQVKIRGNRIELGAITTSLLLKPDLKEAVVTVYKKEDLEHELVAYIVSDEVQNASALRKFLSDRIPEYEIPSYFVQVDKLTLSSNGKVDTKSLPSPEHHKLSTGIAYESPRNEKEEKLIQIFANELGRDHKEIGIHDNFFDLGANSIKLIKILNTINKEFDMDLKPVLLFQYATINALVEYAFTEISEEEDEDDFALSDEIDSLIDLMED
ncbi:amino acid adenylation domain-containing protein [Flavobacterium sp. 9]|uniref:non-ribosomal peptide synthetase n=1 Tax=Flavobacterium sp. 9 TaxID=2035198 RepID=UPI000C197BAF|nr:non-ribosomal peptide synthetase [Flavobacterium sp. 9]PIF30220.1 amino acid adenylation domain-containing protein [Flavobacterium sp. 9]